VPTLYGAGILATLEDIYYALVIASGDRKIVDTARYPK
jgi:hypothetical protein